MGLAPLYKVIALNNITVGHTKEHFDIREPDHKHEYDVGRRKVVIKV